MSPRSTRNSRNLITCRHSRPAWQTQSSPTRAPRSSRSKRKYYKEDSDNEVENDNYNPVTKRTKNISLSCDSDDDDLSVAGMDENPVVTPPSTVVADEDEQNNVESAASKIFKWLPLEVCTGVVSHLTFRRSRQ